MTKLELRREYSAIDPYGIIYFNLVVELFCFG